MGIYKGIDMGTQGGLVMARKQMYVTLSPETVDAMRDIVCTDARYRSLSAYIETLVINDLDARRRAGIRYMSAEERERLRQERDERRMETAAQERERKRAEREAARLEKEERLKREQQESDALRMRAGEKSYVEIMMWTPGWEPETELQRELRDELRRERGVQ